MSCHIYYYLRDPTGAIGECKSVPRPTAHEICPGQKESGRGENVDLRSPKSGRYTRALHRCEALGLGYPAQYDSASADEGLR